MFKTINLYIEGVPGSSLTKCRALSTSTTDIWTHGAATDANNIFYNGGVRAGDETQTSTCNSATEGTQRYNKLLHVMQYCGASGSPLIYTWTTLGGSGLGIGQTWQDVTSTRFYNTTYTNDTGKPIAISITHSSGGMKIYINGVKTTADQGGNNNTYTTTSSIVPSGLTYSVTNPGDKIIWVELR